MKRYEIAMGHAARAFEERRPPDEEVLGELSPNEESLLSRTPAKVRRAEEFLYVALSIAAACRRRLDRTTLRDDEYAADLVKRQRALDQARRHLLVLRAAGAALSDHLESMLTAEGLKL